MKLFGIALLLFLTLLALPIEAQQATITAPVVRNAETKILGVDVAIRRDCACAFLIVEYQDAGGVPTRQVRLDVPVDPANPGTELQTFIGALLNPRTGETGVNSRKLNFRALGYFADAGRLPGVTLVP